MNLHSLLQKHKATKDLLKTLKEETRELKQKKLILPITGLLPSLHDPLLKILEEETHQSFLYATTANTDTLQYFKSIEKLTKPTFSQLLNNLIIQQYNNVLKVTQKAERATKGDIITFWPIPYAHPLRASFFGEELETLEMYDEVFGNKISNISQFVTGDIKSFGEPQKSTSIKLSSIDHKIDPHILIILTDTPEIPNSKFKILNFKFNFTYPPLFFKRFDLLKRHIKQKTKAGWRVLIYSKCHPAHLPDLSNLRERTKRLQAGDAGPIATQQVRFIRQSLPSGFESPSLKIAVLTDRELFGSIYLRQEQKRQKETPNRYLEQFEGEIKIGDYVVHEDHGVAIYRGISKETVNGKSSEFIHLEYAAKDKLFLPLNQIHKITKYIGPKGIRPKITRLGKGYWRAIKTRVKKSIQILAKELLQHYAKREVSKAFKFSKGDSDWSASWRKEFEQKFRYEETEDQLRTIKEVKKDLASETPMNRLIVGDVGFGKTEVAVRAAFKVVEAGKQLALLCPTTILSAQHYSVFSERFKDYPFRIETLSRFQTKQKNAGIVEGLKNGQIDIVIGTHRLLSDDVDFEDLALLIIDEEQRFGVKQKEKIKKLKYGVHVLSMSATPIPRTLGMALASIQDISIISTPPKNRKPIKTYASKLDWNKVCDAILKETKRGGQVYFLHNKVQTIESIKAKLEKLLPDTNFAVAHGQLPPQTLDKVMREFYARKFNVLICTTIIENGIDMPNVNTIIINDAQNFGLAQLYQLRGRVGRSARQAYCYLFYKPFVGTEQCSAPTKRIQAIIDNQDLGSGFNIASQDLEIRGAGNILGKEQSGQISAVGFGLYTQLLAEEVERESQLKIIPTLNF